jgi:hypothetical protein
MTRAVTILALLLLLAGCSATVPLSAPAPVAVSASAIETLDDANAWADSLTGTASTEEMSEGLGRIGELVPSDEIWFETSNELGQDIISLNSDLFKNPDATAEHIASIQAILDRIDAAIAHGDKP